MVKGKLDQVNSIYVGTLSRNSIFKVLERQLEMVLTTYLVSWLKHGPKICLH